MYLLFIDNFAYSLYDIANKIFMEVLIMNLKKIFTLLCIVLIFISSSVFATNVSNNVVVDNTGNIPVETSEESNTTDTSLAAETIYQDLYIYNTDSYSLNDIVYGNVFASTNKFVTNPINNGGTIYGNLYLISGEAIIQSDVVYSNNQDKNGNYIVNTINSYSAINGNVFVLADSFTLQAGSQINGDLYVAADVVNIEQDTVISGNLFVTGSQVTLNGQVSGSAYVTTDTFNMRYFSYITQDLYLNCNNANLSGVVYRNAFVTAYDKLLTESDFRVTQNLSVNFAKDFTFSGEVQGNATFNAKSLNFKNDNSENCIIRGNLTYAVKDGIQIPDGIVFGELTEGKYVERTNNKYSIGNLAFSLFTLLAYVFAIVFLSKTFAKNAISKLANLDIKNTLISLAIGFISVFAIFLLFMLLIFTGIGVALSLFFIMGYLLIITLAIPLFLHDIANIIKLNLNIYLKLLIVTIVFYLISLIPVLGPSVVFILVFIGTGRILFTLFNRKK